MGKLQIVQSMAVPIVAVDGPGGHFQIAREQLETLTEQLAAMRNTIEAATTLLIQLQDVADPNPDDSDQGAEDDFVQHPADGPGCPIADPPELEDEDTAVDDLPCDPQECGTLFPGRGEGAKALAIHLTHVREGRRPC